MFKKLFKQLYEIIFRPTKAWNTLAEEKEEEIIDNEPFLKAYLYPIIGIVALLAFTGVFFHRKDFNVQLALRLMINVLVALFAGFFLASYLLSEAMAKIFSNDKQYKLCQRFVGYSSALVYVMYMILAIFPDFSFLSLILLYTIYIVWEGAISYMQIEEKQQTKFTLITSAIVLLCPFLIKEIMFLTMPGMRI